MAHALSKAYQLETEVAEYPRFVVGNGLLDFIREVEDLVPKTPYGEVARLYAGSCKRMIVQDTDGRQMLDFLGTEGRTRLRESLPAELFSRGHDFVREKHEKFLASGQEKLASRYYRLLQYYLARKAVWGREPASRRPPSRSPQRPVGALRFRETREQSLPCTYTCTYNDLCLSGTRTKTG